MNDSPRANPPRNRGPAQEMRIKVIGVGGAGNNALDRLVLEDPIELDLLACNTDVQALAGSVASHKIQMGRSITRGLGAGGDPEVGFAAAEEAAGDLRGALEGVPLVLVCTGLGGGTGSGATPLIVKIAREQGSLVIVCATLPFSFEGKRRGRQAQEALDVIQQYADAVICFENDRMGELISPESGIHEAFSAADRTISRCVRAVVDLVNRRGLIHLGFDDLFTALRNQDARCLFGYGEAGGPSRGGHALSEALRNPLMERGHLLESAANVLVNIVGGRDLTLVEVQGVMEELSQFISDDTQLLFGASVDPKMDGKIGVTLISSLSARGATLGQSPAPAPATGRAAALPPSEPAAPVYAAPAPEPVVEPRRAPAQAAPVLPQAAPRPAPAPAPAAQARPAAPAPAASEPAPAPVPEPAIRGRFDKSEPTIVEGEDLDVPTFLRKNLRVK